MSSRRTIALVATLALAAACVVTLVRVAACGGEAEVCDDVRDDDGDGGAGPRPGLALRRRPRPGLVDSGPADSPSGGVGGECRTAADCALAVDHRSCCGRPRLSGGELVACPRAVPRSLLVSTVCVVPWHRGDVVPPSPEECAPFCRGVVCSSCAEVDRVACHEGRCVAVALGGCASDQDCPARASCVDPDGDGVSECAPGEHACGTDADCRLPEGCEGCRCLDEDSDGLRECSCWGCGAGRCRSHGACEPHHFCEQGRCVHGGIDACRPGTSEGDCPDGEVCEPSPTDATRGRCVPRAAPDGGLPLPGQER